MIKFVYCVTRKADLTPEKFRAYWLLRHGPLVRSYARAMCATRYVQSHTLETEMNGVLQQARGTQAPYDGITEIWWESMDTLLQAIQTPEGREANQKLAADEANFVDLSQSRVFFTEEHTIFDFSEDSQ